jgi:esterase/lipase superfamily enzyme
MLAALQETRVVPHQTFISELLSFLGQVVGNDGTIAFMGYIWFICSLVGGIAISNNNLRISIGSIIFEKFQKGLDVFFKRRFLMLRIPVEAKNVALAAKVTRGLCASGESDIFRTLLGDRSKKSIFFVYSPAAAEIESGDRSPIVNSSSNFESLLVSTLPDRASFSVVEY